MGHMIHGIQIYYLHFLKSRLQPEELDEFWKNSKMDKKPISSWSFILAVAIFYKDNCRQTWQSLLMLLFFIICCSEKCHDRLISHSDRIDDTHAIQRDYMRKSWFRTLQLWMFVTAKEKNKLFTIFLPFPLLSAVVPQFLTDWASPDQGSSDQLWSRTQHFLK